MAARSGPDVAQARAIHERIAGDLDGPTRDGLLNRSARLPRFGLRPAGDVQGFGRGRGLWPTRLT
ncbi:hypothetical protein [Rhodococcus koreensis]|uniref:hypothetical protein n=1 Tax=Rhodococcus koreensis TaxID=99653 RepID=UPI00197F5D29|nr:hypothetical protein [Rhodococcus koreensis]QSE78167.1 hypothetical protein JWS14_02835 [Rhodococcus koreensis]